MSSKIVPIFFAFDNNYVEPAAVAFYSLLNKAHHDVFYQMYVLHSDITEERQNLLQKIIENCKNAQLSFVNTHGFLSEYWQNGTFTTKSSNSTFTADTLLRYFAAKFFPQHDKIIYSDVDIIVMDDISELYDTDLTDKYIAGVKNPFSKFSNEELSHLQPEYHEMLCDKYIAGGIWVMNLKKIREDKLEDKMLKIIRDNSIIKRWPDQDVINIACAGKVGFIPLNYISYPYLDGYLNLPEFKSDYSRDELYDSLINPKIIHFAANKPWNGFPKYSNLWWTYFHFLNLSKTRIFTAEENTDPEIIRWKKKAIKYKKITFLLSLVFLIVLGILILEVML